MERSSVAERYFNTSNDDLSTEDRPDVKSEDESVPSPEVVELRQKVVKLEKDYQGACRYARQFELRMEEAQKRVEFLENLLETKSVAVVAAKPNQQVQELQKKLAEVSKQLEGERKEAAITVSFLTRQLEEQETRVEYEQKNFFNRIDELKRQLAQYEGPKGKKPRKIVKKALASPSCDYDLVQRDSQGRFHPNYSTNIFEFSTAAASDSVSYSSAVKELRERYHADDEKWCRAYEQAVKFECLECAACDHFLLTGIQVLQHFFSADHASKIRRYDAGVSLITFEYWKRKLESIQQSIEQLEPIEGARHVGGTAEILATTPISFPILAAVDVKPELNVED